MSQPQLTNFFTHAKRGTRSTKAGKVLDAPVEAVSLTPKTTTRGKKVVENSTPNVDEIKKPKIVKAEVVGQQVLKQLSENINVEPKKLEKAEEPVLKEVIVEKPDEVVKEKPKRGRKKVEEETPNDISKDDCPSPAKRTRRTARSKAVDNAIEKAKKLTPSEVKQKLGGVKKLAELKEQLKKIEKSAETVQEAKAKTVAAAKKVAAQKAKVEAKEEYEKTPAFISFHNLAAKGDGTLPLPYTYKFLAEVFRCTDTIAAMLHNRKEIITVEKMKTAVQQMMRKDFSMSYLKQIKTVFPASYRYAWENIIGRYGKKMAEYELHMTVNLDYKSEMVGNVEPNMEKNPTAERLGPQGMVERKTVFHNSLVNIVKSHHKKFCSELETPISVEDDQLVKFHKDFDVDRCPPIVDSDFPEAPFVEKVTTAAQILEKSRALFEINPKLAETLVKAADAKQTGENPSGPTEVKVEAPKPAPKPIRKELQGLPPKLIEKILAKEAEKAAREMFTDKGREEKIKRLRRMPVLARILKNTFTSENKPALPFDMVIKKAVSSYPGHLPSEVMIKDVRYLIEVAKPWVGNPMVQASEYLKLNKNMDVNDVVKQLEKMLADEEK